MRKQTAHTILALIAIVVFASRLWFALSTPEFSTDTAYSLLRQVEQVAQYGAPLFEDPLTNHPLRPTVLYLYVLAGPANVIGTSLAAKIVPNLFAALLIPLAYVFVHRLVRNRTLALVGAATTGFVPVWYEFTFNHASTLPLVALLWFVTLFYFNKADKRTLPLFLIAMVAFSFLSPLSLVFALGLVAYFIVLLVERMPIRKSEVELGLLSMFFILWAQLLLHKQAVLAHGIAVFWQNIPQPLIEQFFSAVSVPEALYKIGLLPVLAGSYIAYRSFFRERHAFTTLLLAQTLAIFIVLWLRIIPLQAGLALLGLVLSVLAFKAVAELQRGLAATRVAWAARFVLPVILILLIPTAVMPSVAGAQTQLKNTPQPDLLRAMDWIKENVPERDIVLALPEEGHLIKARGERATVLDSTFLFVQDASQRFADTQRLFKTRFEIEAVEIMDRYDAKYLLYSPRAQAQYNQPTPLFADGNCFRLEYGEPERGQTQLYRNTCHVREVKAI